MMKIVTGNLVGAVITEMVARERRDKLCDGAVLRAEGGLFEAKSFANNILWAMGYTTEGANKLIDEIVAEERKDFEERHK